MKEVETQWQGVTFRIPSVTRFDANTVLLEVKVVAGPGLIKPVFIGFLDPKEELIYGKMQHKPLPFSLSTASLVDSITQIQYTAVPQPAGQPSYGPSETISLLGLKSSFQMAVEFKLPVPKPNPDGTIPIQKVSVTLPQAKGTIRDVVIPPQK